MLPCSVYIHMYIYIIYINTHVYIHIYMYYIYMYTYSLHPPNPIKTPRYADFYAFLFCLLLCRSLSYLPFLFTFIYIYR
jgi:hypothetical protein